ncbi:MAG: SUMF1/EgtB/PvdO family nonheme iron enzyme, partial [Fuerstiella sp.]|nr:SUMF1/EgtB/PvdO family nonheme iron enzyme [Fuerstiella sp.]
MLRAIQGKSEVARSSTPIPTTAVHQATPEIRNSELIATTDFGRDSRKPTTTEAQLTRDFRLSAYRGQKIDLGGPAWELAPSPECTLVFPAQLRTDRDARRSGIRSRTCQTCWLGTNEVARTLPNPWGFYDMPGNKFEWCSDILADYPIGPVNDPSGPSLDSGGGINPGSRRVLRGGNSGSAWEFVRSAAR